MGVKKSLAVELYQVLISDSFSQCVYEVRKDVHEKPNFTRFSIPHWVYLKWKKIHIKLWENITVAPVSS